jgi:hypothetical protein
MRDSALDSRIGSADWPSLPGWQRLLLTSLIVCLPVPMLAASGLAVPLPPIVYRVAVGLAERTQAVAVGVPGFEAVIAEATETPRGGVIRLSAQERAATASAGEAEAHEAFADVAASGHGTRRPVAVAGEARAPSPGHHHAVRVSSAGGRAATEESQESAAVVSAEADAGSPVTVPPAEQSSYRPDDEPRPAATPQPEGANDGPSPRASDEPRGAPSDSSPRPQEPRSDTPQDGGVPEPPPAGSGTPNSGSVPVTPPSPPVDTPKPGSRPVTPPGQTETPNDTPNPVLPVTPPRQVDRPNPVTPPLPVVTPAAPVNAPNTGSLPVTAPGKSSGSSGAPHLPGEPELPVVPRPPRIPGRPE